MSGSQTLSKTILHETKRKTIKLNMPQYQQNNSTSDFSNERGESLETEQQHNNDVKTMKLDKELKKSNSETNKHITQRMASKLESKQEQNDDYDKTQKKFYSEYKSRNTETRDDSEQMLSNLVTQIKQIQERDPAIAIYQDLISKYSVGYAYVASPIEIPHVGLSIFDEIVVTDYLSAIAKDDFIKKFLDMFHMREELQNTEGLHHLYEIFLLNKNEFFGIMFAEETISDVKGVLEYNPSLQKAKLCEFLRETPKLTEVSPVRRPGLSNKIRHTNPVQYIKDITLPTLSELSKLALKCIVIIKEEIFDMNQDNEKLSMTSLIHLMYPVTDEANRRILKEFYTFSETFFQQEGSVDSFVDVIKENVDSFKDLCIQINEIVLKISNQSEDDDTNDRPPQNLRGQQIRNIDVIIKSINRKQLGDSIYKELHYCLKEYYDPKCEAAKKLEYEVLRQLQVFVDDVGNKDRVNKFKEKPCQYFLVPQYTNDSLYTYSTKNAATNDKMLKSEISPYLYLTKATKMQLARCKSHAFKKLEYKSGQKFDLCQARALMEYFAEVMADVPLDEYPENQILWISDNTLIPSKRRIIQPEQNTDFHCNSYHERLLSFHGYNLVRRPWTRFEDFPPGPLVAAGFSCKDISGIIRCNTCGFTANVDDFTDNDEGHAFKVHSQTKNECSFLKAFAPTTNVEYSELDEDVYCCTVEMQNLINLMKKAGRILLKMVQRLKRKFPT